MATDRRAHWDTVYTTKATDAVSWFQPEPTQSLLLLRRSGLTARSCVIDVGGGDSHLVDRLVEDEGCTCVAVLDVSEAALHRAQQRMGANASTVEWLATDVTADWSVTPRDFWHDRAVFHFLTEPADRARYVECLRRTVKRGGIVLIATFALDGPEKCSGLPVARYSPDLLKRELGPDFVLTDSISEVHRTPWGAAQSFNYSVFTFG
jgi:cyclopropane fatty-acyl-phospholipid synthase-like methyltransferase